MSSLKKTYMIGFFLLAFIGIGLVTMRAAQKKELPGSDYAQIEILLKQAIEHYEKKNLQQAADLIANNHEALVGYEDGCNLMVSVYAELENQSLNLEKISRLCLKHESGVEIAIEGLAKSLLEQGKAEMAIQELEKLRGKVRHDRYYAALANLYLSQKEFGKAADQFVSILSQSEIWSAWLIRYLRLEGISSQRPQLRLIANIVLGKPAMAAIHKQTLAKKLKEQGFNDLAHQVEQIKDLK